MDAAKRDELLHTALFNRDGESVEGGFVDYFVYYADIAREELVSQFTAQGFTESDAQAIRAALRQPEVSPEAGASLLWALHPWLPQEADALYHESEPRLRAVAAQILNRSRHWHEKKPLVTPGLEDPSAYVRLVALKTLIENRRTVPECPALLLKMLEDPDSAVRRLVIKNLDFFRNPQNQTALIKTWDSDTDWTVRNTVLRWVAEETRRQGVHYAPENVAQGIGEGLIQRLITALENPDPELRATVARALERVAGMAVVKAMIARLKVETDHDARCALLYFPRYQDDSASSLPLLLATLHNRANASQQTLAAWLLPAFGRAIEPDLIAILSGENEPGPRRACAMGIGSIGSLSSLPMLLHAWRDPAMTFADREIARAIRDVVIRAAHEGRHVLPPGTSERVQACLTKYETGRYDVRHHCKFVLGALPVHATLIYIWAIRPDGAIVCIDHEAFGYPSELETDPLRLFATWVHGAVNHPELAECIPLPPKTAEPCKFCRVRGHSEQGEHCFACSGLGWVARA